MQDTRVRSLIREDPTWLRNEARVPQLWSLCSRAHTPKREACSPQLESIPRLTATREYPHSNEDLAQPKIQLKNIYCDTHRLPESANSVLSGASE